MTTKQNPELTFAFLIDNEEDSKQTAIMYNPVVDVESLQVGSNIVGSIFTDMYIFQNEFVGSFIQEKIQEDMDDDKSYTVLVFNVESKLDIQVVEDALYKVLTEEDSTLGAYEYEITIVAMYAFRSDGR